MRISRRKVIVTGAALIVVVAVALAGTGWYLSGLIESGALNVKHDPEAPNMEVASLGRGTVTLRRTADADEDGAWTKPGIWGLEWASGYGQAGEIVQKYDESVVRRFTEVRGAPPVGQKVRLDSYSFSGDPATARGLSFEEVAIPGPLGKLPAWLIGGSRDTWAIFVHGWRGDRAEALRLLPSVVEAGYPSLVVTYRNDEGAPPSTNGYYGFGTTEWEDLHAAVAYAVDWGARDVVLVGYSMGGAIVVSFLYESDLASRVRAAVLDSPLLDFQKVIDLGAEQRSIPGPLTAIGKLTARLRFDIDWGDTDYLARVDELTTPVLLFHGEDDDRVPIETSDALAAVRPDLVTYVRVPNATHGRAWNMDPAVYEQEVVSFLRGKLS